MMQQPLALSLPPVPVQPGDTKPRRMTCTDHCSACGAHFHGTGAFDAHRQGEQGSRYCAEPSEVVMLKGKREGLPALQVWTDAGSCASWSNGKRTWIEGVMVWQLYGAAYLVSRNLGEESE